MSSRQRFANPTGFSLNRKSVGDGDKKEFVAGESTKETVKTIARGKPGDFGVLVVTTVCLPPMHTGRGCSGHPAFPAPSDLEGHGSFQTSRVKRGEIAEPYLEI